jgi:hypothetical protein
MFTVDEHRPITSRAFNILPKSFNDASRASPSLPVLLFELLTIYADEPGMTMGAFFSKAESILPVVFPAVKVTRSAIYVGILLSLFLTHTTSVR